MSKPGSNAANGKSEKGKVFPILRQSRGCRDGASDLGSIGLGKNVNIKGPELEDIYDAFLVHKRGKSHIIIRKKIDAQLR